MLTLINWLIVAALVWYITGSAKRAFDTLGHMLAYSLVTTAALWWLTGTDKVDAWWLAVRLIPAAALLLLCCMIAYGGEDDSRDINST